MDVPAETGNQNMCEGCTIPCCRMDIRLTSYDIVRIMLGQGRKPGSFAILVEDEDSPESFLALGRKIRFMMKYGRSGFCVLHNAKRKLKCTAEEVKPAVCLVYPMGLMDGRPVVRADAICPVSSLKKADFSKMSKSTLEDACWELERYWEIVGDWNASAKGNEEPEDFFRFALGEMHLESSIPGSVQRRMRRLLAFLFPAAERNLVQARR